MRLKFLIWTLAIFSSTALLEAQNLWEEPFHPDAAALLAEVDALEPARPGFADGVYQHTHFHWQSDYRRTITQRTLYRVTNAAAAANTIRAAASWAPWFQERPVIKARVIGPGGAERWLDPDTLSEQAAPASQPGAYEGLRSLAAPLPGIADGVVVELEVVMQDRRPMLDSPMAESMPLVSVGPVRRVVVEIDAPAEFDLRWKAQELPDARVEESDAGDRRTLRFTMDDVEAFDRQALMRLASSGGGNTPTLRFSTGGEWGDVAAAYRKLVEEQLDGQPVPGEWPAGEGDRTARIAQLVRRMHEKVRYEALLLGQASIQPRRPDETLSRGYGDCKDKALLLKAVLAEAGVDSRLALLRVGAADDVEPELPGFGQFNHVILYLPGEQPLWVDATAELTPVGELPALAQGRWALILDEATTGLVKTPESTSADNRVVQRLEQILEADGSLVARMEQESFGVLAEGARRQMLQGPEAFKEAIVQRVGDTSGVEYEMSSFEADEARSLETPHRIRTTTTVTRKGARYAQDLMTGSHSIANVLGSLPPNVWLPVQEDAEPIGLKLPAAYRFEIELRVLPPAGYKLRQLPAADRRELGPAFLETVWQIEEDGAVAARSVFDTVVQEFDPEQATAFRRGLAELRTQKPVTMVFEDATALGLRTGSFQAALEAAQKRVREDPANLLAATRLVDALLAVGAGSRARDEAHRLTAEFPDEPAAHMALGEALLHGTLGQRRGGRDLDRDGAVDAFERALELDAEGRKPVLKLIEALTFAPDGSRFNPQSRMEEALETARRELEHEATLESAKPLLRQQETILLSYAGRYEELARSAAPVPGYADFHAIEAAAAAEGIEAALSLAGDIKQPLTRRMQIAQAGSQLLYMRRYELSQRLFEAAAQDGAAAQSRDPQTDYYEAQGRRAAGLRRHEELREELAGPEQVAHDWMMIPYRDDWRDEMARMSGSSCGNLELRDPERGAEFERRATAAKYSTGFMGPAVDHAADWTVSQTRLVVEGDEESGYWVRGYTQADANPAAGPWITAFIERQNGALKVLDAASYYGASLTDLGCTLAARLDTDGLESVKAWLDRIAGTRMPGLEGFQTFWCPQCRNAESDARVALALLQSADSSRSEVVIPILEEAYRQEKGLDRRTAAARGLASALGLAGEKGKAAALLTAFAEEFPLLTPIVAAAARAHADLGDVDRAKALLESGLEASPQHVDLLRLQLTLAMGAGDIANALRVLGRIEALSQASPADYNNAAWAAVVAGRADQGALTAIRKGLTLAKTSPYLLNTESALQALEGNPDRARAIWYQALFRERSIEPSDGAYLVAAMILEEYGLIDEARRTFERALASGDSSPAGSAELARKALERLGSR